MPEATISYLQNRDLEAGAWLEAIIESSNDAILSKTLDGVITSWNPAAQRMFGFSAREAIGQPLTIIIPNDRLSEEDDILKKIRHGERIENFRTTRQRQDGSRIDVSVTVSPVRDKNGVIRGASKILRDITDHKQAEDQQNLLMREINHRTKNLFAVVAGLVTISARNVGTKEDLIDVLSGRINALAHSHALTLPNPGQPVVAHRLTTLTALLHAVLAPYSDQYTIELDGDDVPIGSNRLSALALMLHEFATNAAKYGAFSSQEGRLTVQLSSADGCLKLVWIEILEPGLLSELRQRDLAPSLKGLRFVALPERSNANGGRQDLLLCWRFQFSEWPENGCERA